MSLLKRNRYKITFFAILLFTLVPLLFFPLRSIFSHSLYGFPTVEDGVLDLAGYDLSTRRPIPLDGRWEFFYNRKIVGAADTALAPDMLLSIPELKNPYDNGHSSQPGRFSYRLTLKNCPGDVRLLCYIPNICSQYRVYLNGTLIARRGAQDSPDVSCPGPEESRNSYTLRQGLTVPAGSTASLVVEVLGSYVDGLYMTPLLTEQSNFHLHADIRGTLEAVFIGIISTALFFITWLLICRDNLLSSTALVVMDLLVFVRLLLQRDYHIFPIRSYLVSILLQIATLFLPVAFLFCVRKLTHTDVSNRSILCVTLFETVLSPFILFYALTGRLGLAQLLCIVGYLPFIYIMRVLYQSVCQEISYSLVISTVLFLLLSSMTAASLSFSGWLNMRIDLYPSACFMVSMLMQLWLSMRHSLDMQKEAAEAGALRLQLRESALNLRLSQIKPHFLYNTLLAIHMLCTQAPETAAEITLKFANYLRTNMNFIETRALIPFAQELAHIQNYTDIEQLRFQKRLTVRYAIQTSAFSVPPLSIQPLVENAIRHGACKNIRGGSVTLSTWETEDAYCIDIRDDGPGFDPGPILENPDSVHGLPNILFRLRMQRNAQVHIESDAASGTVVHVCLPKEVSP